MRVVECEAASACALFRCAIYCYTTAYMRLEKTEKLRGWGVTDPSGAEMWDAHPVIPPEGPSLKVWAKLLCYPKKFLLYRALMRDVRKNRARHSRKQPYRILDIGCGTGSTLIDLKRIFGREVEVVGIDVIKLQTEVAQKKLAEHGVYAEVHWYDGTSFPFTGDSFHAVYSSDVLGHVEDVPTWLSEIQRVLKGGGVIAMFAESSIGRHAFARRYLEKKGVNIDPHAEYHISLYSKQELRRLFAAAHLQITTMLGVFWLKLIAHPHEFYESLQSREGFWIIKKFTSLLVKLREKTHPYYAGAAELYGLVEMLTIGRVLEGQGFIILARKPSWRDLSVFGRRKP